jgi:integrase
VQRSTKVSSKKEARNIEKAAWTQLARGEVGIQERKPVPMFPAFAVRFREEMKLRHAAKRKTVAHYVCGVKKLLEYEPFNVRLDRIDEELIAAYVKWRGAQKHNGKPYAVATLNRQVEVLRRLLRVAVDWKVIPRSPKIVRLPGENQRDRIISHDEEARYLAAAAPLLREIATILVDTGLRPEECHRLRWEHVSLDPIGKARFGHIYIPSGKTKNARRNVPLTSRSNAFLSMRLAAEHQKEGWVFPSETRSGHIEDSTLRRLHANALKDSGVTPFVFYSLRHTALTRLGEAGADPFSIQKIAGHHSIVISQRYVHPSPERIESAFTLLESYNAEKEKQAAEERKRGTVVQ